ncbi:MAG: hypothetical protein RLY20_1538 [Verrucomicrobiota bacterium]
MGKSACANILQRLGFNVLDTDDIARDLTQPGSPALQEIQSVFGAGLIDSAGQLRRDKLADLAFNDTVLLRKLEAILHPAIKAAWRAQLAEWRDKGVARAVVVIPLLFETECEADFQTTVCIACSAQTQFQRLRHRGWSAAESHRRIAAQLPIEEKISRAHRVLWSEGSLQSLAGQIDRVFCV